MEISRNVTSKFLTMILRSILSLLFIIKLCFKQTNNVRQYIYIYIYKWSVLSKHSINITKTAAGNSSTRRWGICAGYLAFQTRIQGMSHNQKKEMSVSDRDFFWAEDH